jgi:prolyl 4-hydroxylase
MTIQRREPLGFAVAPITTAAGFVIRRDIRNNEPVMFDDVGLAAELFGRVREQLPARLFGGSRSG